MNEQRRVLDPLVGDIKEIKQNSIATHDTVIKMEAELTNNTLMTQRHDKAIYGNGWPGIKAMVYTLYVIFTGSIGLFIASCFWGK